VFHLLARRSIGELDELVRPLAEDLVGVAIPGHGARVDHAHRAALAIRRPEQHGAAVPASHPDLHRDVTGVGECGGGADRHADDDRPGPGGGAEDAEPRLAGHELDQRRLDHQRLRVDLLHVLDDLVVVFGIFSERLHQVVVELHRDVRDVLLHVVLAQVHLLPERHRQHVVGVDRADVHLGVALEIRVGGDPHPVERRPLGLGLHLVRVVQEPGVGRGRRLDDLGLHLLGARAARGGERCAQEQGDDEFLHRGIVRVTTA
jgi:hypothetical protein